MIARYCTEYCNVCAGTVGVGAYSIRRRTTALVCSMRYVCTPRQPSVNLDIIFAFLPPPPLNPQPMSWQDLEEMLPKNPAVVADMTALHHIHEPGILHNLKERARPWRQTPYTFMVSKNVLIKRCVVLCFL